MEVFGVADPKQRHRPRQSARIFTLEQANRTLPLVSRIVADIVRQHKKVCDLEDIYQRPGSGASSEEGRVALRDKCLAEVELLRELRDELAAVGCQLKDWRRGIVDFFAIRDGRPIEFCWRLGEDRISHWHDAGAGFRARQPMDQEFLAGLCPKGCRV
jgi:hypothetical protein